MMDLKIALGQINMTVGNIRKNADKIIQAIEEAKKEHADIIVFPELALCGYPPLDLVLEDEFVQANQIKIEKIAKFTEGILALVGYVHLHEGKRWNALAVMQHGKIIANVHKTNLPTYDVFDELRYFSYSNDPEPVEILIKGKMYKLGIEICEDLWDDRYETKVTRELVKKGAEIILNASASPFQVGKIKQRIALVSGKVAEGNVPFIYTNMVGGQDELIFDGHSFAIDKNGKFAAYLKPSKEEIAYCEFKDGLTVRNITEPQFDDMAELRAALQLGIKDYFYKSGFKDAVLGLSGGIDSALVATLAAEALGKDDVYVFAMPSPLS